MECDMANLIDNHTKRIDVRLLRRVRLGLLVKQLWGHPKGGTSASWRCHRNADRRVAQ